MKRILKTMGIRFLRRIMYLSIFSVMYKVQLTKYLLLVWDEIHVSLCSIFDSYSVIVAH